MKLIEATAAPPDAIVSPVLSYGRIVLRTARWPALPSDGPAAGTVVICTGRSEFIEKYYEVVGDLRQRGFEVVVFDWRGQGLSGRILRNPLKGHVGHFSDYERDLVALVRQVLEPFCPRPWHALAHSMGGPVTLHFAATYPEVFTRIVLSAPMIDLAGLRSPNLARVVARTLCLLGLGQLFIPIARRSLFLSTFEGNVLTSDPRRFARTATLLRAKPDLAVTAPTIRWVHSAFESMAALGEESFPQRLVTPSLFIMPGGDLVVDARAAERLSARLRASTFVVIRGARHEVLMERDTLRDQFWSAFDAFVPGTASLPHTEPQETVRSMQGSSAG